MAPSATVIAVSVTFAVAVVVLVVIFIWALRRYRRTLETYGHVRDQLQVSRARKGNNQGSFSLTDSNTPSPGPNHPLDLFTRRRSLPSTASSNTQPNFSNGELEHQGRYRSNINSEIPETHPDLQTLSPSNSANGSAFPFNHLRAQSTSADPARRTAGLGPGPGHEADSPTLSASSGTASPPPIPPKSLEPNSELNSTADPRTSADDDGYDFVELNCQTGEHAPKLPPKPKAKPSHVKRVSPDAIQAGACSQSDSPKPALPHRTRTRPRFNIGEDSANPDYALCTGPTSPSARNSGIPGVEIVVAIDSSLAVSSANRSVNPNYTEVTL